MTQTLFDILKKRILILDGGMGTLIQSNNLTENDFRSNEFTNHKKILSGCHDILNITQAEIIYNIHAQYLEAGADIIETNSFNANALSLSDYQLENEVYRINFEAARLARRAADEFSSLTPNKPRFVAGSVGPTSKTLSISPDINKPEYRNINFDELASAYFDQIIALVDGKVDIILIETIFDSLNARAAVYAAQQAFKRSGKHLPLMLSATITDNSGRNLSGQTIEAFNTTFEHLPLLSIGLNCSFGAHEMTPYIAQLSRISSHNICAYPNAGLPNELGSYDEKPEDMAALIENFCRNSWINIIGGCCGTTPKHIQLISQIVENYKPRNTLPKDAELKLSGLESITFNKNSNFINIGERTNVTGSKLFAETIKNGDYKKAVNIARKQINDGAQIIDICMDDAMLNINECMATFLNYLASEPDISKIPFMIDSSDWDVITAAIKCIQGRPIINSISLKEGEEPFITKATQIKDWGAAVVVMCFDEIGQADSYYRKIEVAERSYNILINKVGFNPSDIIFDPNVLAIGTGIEEHNNFACDFIKAVAWIKQNLPYVNISGGVSNLSFAFRGNELIRTALHSVFLYHAYNAGMNMGIVNPAHLILYEEIPEELKILCENLIFNKKIDATEDIIAYMQSHKENTLIKKQNDLIAISNPVERLKYAIIHGLDENIKADVSEVVKSIPNPVSLIEGPLMEAMNYVGTQFGEGKMFLPQVVKTARVMRMAVNALTPFLNENTPNKTAQKNGKVIIATVKGDVHDIGKNIVSLVLSCNNTQVIDLGVMVPAEKIVDEAKKNKADIIALSGLITPSLHEMIYVAQIMQANQMKIPLLIGGAASSAVFTAVKIAPAYQGPVFYIKDASMAARVVSELNSSNVNDFLIENKSLNEKISQQYLKKSEENQFVDIQSARKSVINKAFYNEEIIIPNFIGLKNISDIPLSNIAEKIDWNGFFASWKLNKNTKNNELLGFKNEVTELLKSLIISNGIQTEVIIGIFQANSVVDDIKITTDKGEEHVLHMLRRQQKTDDNTYFSLADFVKPESSITKDYLGLFLLSVTLKESYNDEYYNLLSKSLMNYFAEALSDYVFEESLSLYWGINENPYNYAIKPAVGYPCFPDHSEKETIFNILKAQENSKVILTENFAMSPSSSICGLFIVNPKAKYFNIGKISEDQLQDYALRKNVKIDYLQKFISTNVL